jgi:hypothetical protein
MILVGNRKRTDPYVRDYRIRFLSWMRGVKLDAPRLIPGTRVSRSVSDAC